MNSIKNELLYNEIFPEEIKKAKHRKQYYSELALLKKKGQSPVGVYAHLSSLEEFVKWYNKNEQMFHPKDRAKDIIW